MPSNPAYEALTRAVNRAIANGAPVIVGRPVTHILLAHANSGGFWGTLAESRDADTGIFMGDIGARSRTFWRNYAKRNGYKLVEER